MTPDAMAIRLMTTWICTNVSVGMPQVIAASHEPASAEPCRTSGAAYVANVARFVENAQRRWLPVVGARLTVGIRSGEGNAIWSFVHIDEAVAATQPRQGPTLGSGRGLSCVGRSCSITRFLFVERAGRLVVTHTA